LLVPPKGHYVSATLHTFISYTQASSQSPLQELQISHSQLLFQAYKLNVNIYSICYWT